MDVSLNNYRYELSQQLENIYKIELISYSLPDNLNNIDSTNNYINYKIYVTEDNTIENNIELEIGHYNIDELITELNNNFKNILSDSKIIFKNEKNFICIESDINIDIYDCILINDILGFEKGSTINNNYYRAKNNFDLRISNYVNLNIKNISDKSFSKLGINGFSKGNIEFNEPITLSYLDIEFTNHIGIQYDFNGLYHSLIFKIDTLNMNDDNYTEEL